jgi:hypothetical protein
MREGEKDGGGEGEIERGGDGGTERHGQEERTWDG